MQALIRFFTQQGVFANLITFFVIVIGIYSALTIKRETFPNVNYDILFVTTIYPGASAEETERFITNPLEQELKELDGIKRMSSVSTEGRSFIILQLDPDQTTSEQLEPDVEDIVDAFQDLPEDAEDPVVTVLESKLIPIVEVSISGEISEEKLRETAKFLEKEIERLPDVAKTEFNGLRDYEIKVEALPHRLSQYRVTLQDLIIALKDNNINIPGGTLEANDRNDKEMIIRTVGEFTSVEDVEQTVITANALAQPIRVKDVAKVTMGFEKASEKYRTRGVSSMSMTVLRKDKADAIRLVDKLKQRIEELKPQLDPTIEISYLNDFSYFIRRRLSVLTNNMIVGLVLVLIILSLMLPWRIAAVTAFGIPFSFLATIAYFHMAGISINLITMIGLIIVVGMLVDDAVVITENAQRNIEDGLDPEQAAIAGASQVWAPVTVSVLTTILAFAPITFMTGIFGKFVSFIPIGVISALLISLWEVFFILPHHIARWVKTKDAHAKKSVFSRLWSSMILPFYEKLLKKLLAFRWLVAVCTILFFVFSGYVAINHVDFILFPPGGIEQFQVDISAPVGTPLNRTSELLRPIEDVLSQLPKDELDSFTTKVGVQQTRADDPNTKRGSEYAQVMVYLTPATDRMREAKEIIESVRKQVGKIEGLDEVVFSQVQGGPPVGAPVSLGIRGESYAEILSAVQSVEQYLRQVEGITDIRNTYTQGKDELRLKVNKAEAAAANLSIREIGTGVRAAFEGIVATSIKKLDEEIDIRVQLPQQSRSTVTSLNQLSITNRLGHQIPLSSVVQVSKDRGVAVYEHENNERQVRVTADVETNKITSQQANALLRKQIEELQKQHPQVNFHFGGEDEDTKESMASLKRAFLIAALSIFLIMILLFQNVIQPLVILTTIPLGVMGVIWTFFLHQQPLSFLAMLGVVALAGVIVNNAIVFIDFVNKARSRGMSARESIIQAGTQRLRPIFLTTVTTVAGILPTAYGIGGLDPFIVPIALSLGWGIFFGSILTTMVLPPVLAITDDITGGLRWMMQNLAKRKNGLNG